MESVYLFDPSAEEVVAEGVRSDGGAVVVQDEALSPSEVDSFVAISKQSFYQHEAVQDVVPESTWGTQVHVECMVCGFETVYGVRALIKDGRWENERNGYPKWTSSCRECGENAWKEIERQSGTCDWSDSFEWAETPTEAAE